MRIAIVIGSYGMADFVRLNILSCQSLLGRDVPILVSDDRSAVSGIIQDMAEQEGASYYCSDSRMSHFSGDMQSFINGLVFGQDMEVDVVIKLSQRLIPVDVGFFKAMDSHIADGAWVMTPGRIPPQQIARPGARFYLKFGMLTDVVGVAVGKVSPDELAEVYRNRFKDSKSHLDSMVELTWGDMLAGEKFKDHHRLVPEWTEHVPMKPKLYLRKSQATPHEYISLSRGFGMEQSSFDLREWMQIEGRDKYLMRPNCV